MNTPSHQLNKIEQALFEREAEALNKEISKGLDIIVFAFSKYADSWGRNGDPSVDVDGDKLNQLREYLNGEHLLGRYYYAGLHLTSGDLAVSKDYSKVPEFLRDLMLKKAVTEFLAQVDSVGEVANMAEEALNRSQG